MPLGTTKLLSSQIVPLLEEYWFDNDDAVREWSAKLMLGI